jgi:hypothetical protein
VFAQTYAVVSAEEYAACGTRIFGSSGDQQTVGTSGDHVQGEGTGLNGSAHVRPGVDPCDSDPPINKYYNFHQDNGGEIMHFYDTRNTS